MLIFILALGLTFSGGFIYLWSFCIKNSLDLRAGRSQRVRYALMFVFLFSMFLTSFLRCAFERPPQLSLVLEKLKVANPRAFQILTAGRNGEGKYCKSCQIYKTGRIHHCKRSQQCIFSYDHYCPWLACCIGIHNYRLFYLQSIYGCIMGLLVCSTLIFHLVKTLFAQDYSRIKLGPESDEGMIEETDESIKTEQKPLPTDWMDKTPWWKIGLLMYAIALTTAVFVSLGEFSIRYFRYIAHNITLMDNDLVTGGFRTNFVRVFGENPILWFIPVSNQCIPGTAKYSGFYVDGKEILFNE